MVSNINFCNPMLDEHPKAMKMPKTRFCDYSFHLELRWRTTMVLLYLEKMASRPDQTGPNRKFIKNR